MPHGAGSESTLIKIVYACGEATRHRRPPASTPPLPARPWVRHESFDGEIVLITGHSQAHGLDSAISVWRAGRFAL